MLKTIESVLTKRANPVVHRMNFGNLTQHESESIQDFLVRIRTLAIDCELSCPTCSVNISAMHIRDQFIRVSRTLLSMPRHLRLPFVTNLNFNTLLTFTLLELRHIESKSNRTAHLTKLAMVVVAKTMASLACLLVIPIVPHGERHVTPASVRIICLPCADSPAQPVDSLHM